MIHAERSCNQARTPSPKGDQSAAPVRPSGEAARNWWRRHPVARAVLFALGVLLILLGALLGFVPLLPGFPLGIVGIALLSMSSRRVRNWLARQVHRLPEKLRSRLHFLHGHTPIEPGMDPKTIADPAE